MRYATFSLASDPTLRLGVVYENSVGDVKALIAGRWAGAAPESLLDLIQSGPDAWRRMAELLNVRPTRKDGGSGTYEAKDVRWHAPIPRPRKNIVCLGINYKSHAIESAMARGREPKMPAVPVFFTKAPTAVNGPYDSIPWDRTATQQVDYEAELGVIIGLTGKNIPRDRALQHVFGYTIINDVSARDVQTSHLQWFKGKSLDGFCPMGPVVVTSDQLGDPQTKRLALRVNGDTRQEATTAEMIFPVDVIIEFLSRGMTLEAGDVIATGTPEGVGLGRTPPEYLKDGDLVETEIEDIGLLRNRIVLQA